MSARKVNPAAKFALEFGPILLFFAAYTMFKDDTFTVGGIEYTGFVAVTAGFIPVLLACSGILWKLSGKLSRMQAVTAVLVILFGGLSVWFNDERFFKIKPTVIYLLFAAILGVGLLLGKSAVQYVLEEAMPMKQEGWMILTRRTTAFFVLLAVANEFVWRTMSTDAWVNFKTFGLPLALFLFLFSQGLMLRNFYVDDMGQEAANK